MTMQSKGWLLLPRRRGLAASNLHEELDERRDKNNDGRPESDFNFFGGQPPSYVDLRTMERISSKKKNRVACCDLHCLDILYKVRLLTLESLPPSVTEPTSHIQ